MTLIKKPKYAEMKEVTFIRNTFAKLQFENSGYSKGAIKDLLTQVCQTLYDYTKNLRAVNIYSYKDLTSKNFTMSISEDNYLRSYKVTNLNFTIRDTKDNSYNPKTFALNYQYDPNFRSSYIRIYLLPYSTLNSDAYCPPLLTFIFNHIKENIVFSDKFESRSVSATRKTYTFNMLNDLYQELDEFTSKVENICQTYTVSVVPQDTFKEKEYVISTIDKTLYELAIYRQSFIDLVHDLQADCESYADEIHTYLLGNLPTKAITYKQRFCKGLPACTTDFKDIDVKLRYEPEVDKISLEIIKNEVPQIKVIVGNGYEPTVESILNELELTDLNNLVSTKTFKGKLNLMLTNLKNKLDKHYRQRIKIYASYMENEVVRLKKG